MSQDQPTAQVTVEDFFRVDIRVGRVIRAEPFPKARKPAYKLWIDFGELGVKKSSAQITAMYTPGELIGKSIIGVTNFPPRQIANFTSDVLVLGVPVGTDNRVVLLHPGADVPVGSRVA